MFLFPNINLWIKIGDWAISKRYAKKKNRLKSRIKKGKGDKVDVRQMSFFI